MEKDLITLLAERDVLKHKAELDRLREENLRLLQQVSEKIDHAQLEITDKAISRSMEVLEKTRLWLQWGAGAFALLITIAGYIGFSSLDKQLTAYYTDTVHNWLRFDDGNSGGRRALEDLRTSALLDSLTLRYQRELANSGFAQVKLNAAEEQRLMALILAPGTEEYQFRDAVNLIINSRGIFGRVYDDETGRKLAGIVSNHDFSNNKKAWILTALKQERSLLPLTRAMLNDTSGANDEGIQMDAFDNVRQFDEQLARSFAQQHLNQFKSDRYRTRLAVYLISIDADSNDIDRLQEELKQKKNELWSSGYQSIVYARITKSLGTQPLDVTQSAQLLATQIKAGMKLLLISDLNQKPYIHLSLERYSQALENTQQLLGNADLVDAIVKTEPLTKDNLLKMSEFFQLNDRGYWLTTLMMKPAEDTRLLLVGNRQIAGNEVLDSIWLRVEKRAGADELVASWRDRSGAAQEAIVSKVMNVQNSHFRVDYNEQQLTSYTWHPDFGRMDLL